MSAPVVFNVTRLARGHFADDESVGCERDLPIAVHVIEH
jgi:hypothetical protein